MKSLVMGLMMVAPMIAAAQSDLTVVDDELSERFDFLINSLDSNSHLKKAIKDERSGMYLLVTDTGGRVYSDRSATSIITGDMIEVNNGVMSNRTQSVLAKELFSIPRDEVIVYPAKEPKLATVLIFYDIDCEFCQRMHRDTPFLQNSGLEVRYLAYPRSGVLSESASVMKGIWCRDGDKPILDYISKAPLSDRQLLIEKGGTENKCNKNVVFDQYSWGRSLNLSGTPALVFESGEVINHSLKASTIIEKAFAD
ncbi:thioredoxin fold domain-containing protein [Marinomonas sp. 2405UD68-3]|uniref:thioredoxin fold domain-containing protein n=1 Tax=Marinomonas sp. 2405UD68-3 TaxID=3391835 RepID=UPI0039C90892